VLTLPARVRSKSVSSYSSSSYSSSSSFSDAELPCDYTQMCNAQPCVCAPPNFRFVAWLRWCALFAHKRHGRERTFRKAVAARSTMSHCCDCWRLRLAHADCALIRCISMCARACAALTWARVDDGSSECHRVLAIVVCIAHRHTTACIVYARVDGGTHLLCRHLLICSQLQQLPAVVSLVPLRTCSTMT
jgi:hypothetical protein